MASRFRGRERQATRLLPETQWTKEEPMASGIPPADTVVVTISRQFGSGGAEIGRLVAQAASLAYIDHEIIDEVAKRLGVEVHDVDQQDEHTVGNARHILEAIQANHPLIGNYQSLLKPNAQHLSTQELAYFHLTQKVILELASRGNAVIIGRGSQFLLHGAPRTLHIYIFAPLPYRISNAMKHLHIDHAQATKLIEQRDSEHNRYLRHYYGSDGNQPGLYHLLINTGLFSFEQAADLIKQGLPVIKAIG